MSAALERVLGLLGAATAALAALACSPSGPRDVAGENKDVRVDPREAGAAPADAYAYIAQRPHGVVALAEARNLKDDDAHAIVERLASELEACATRLAQEGALVEGAARVVAIAQPEGPPALKVTVEPGGAIAQNALLCLVAPIRAISLPRPEKGVAAGMAIEAKWGPVAGSAAAPPPSADAAPP